MDKREFQIRARFRHAVRQAGLPDGARLLVAVSGGADSVALLRLCLRDAPARGWRLTVGHIDHGLRPESSDDAAWVRSLCRRLSLPYAGLRVKAGHWQSARGQSVEAEARRLRRRGLRRLARKRGAEWILLGHTRDDQAETVLLRLLRGSGRRGLGGMAPKKAPWLRPLLEVSGQDLRAMLQRVGWEYREDSTNSDLRFQRNRVRHRLLPLLRQEYQAGIDALLARTARAFRQGDRYLKRQADRAWRTIRVGEGADGIRLDRLKLASYHPAVAEEVLLQAYRKARGTARDLGQAHLETLFRLVRSGRGGAFHLPGGLKVVLDRREILLQHPKQDRREKRRGESQAADR